GDGIAPIAHCFGLAEGRRDASGVEMIAADHDRRLELSVRDEIVERDAELRARAEPEPTNARGQTLEPHLLSREPDPAREMLILWKELERQLVGPIDVGGITGERDPPERSLALAEQ